MRVLVPIEDPLFAACIIEFIAQHRWPRGTEFLVLHVIEPSLLEHPVCPTLSPLLQSCDESLIEQVTNLVNSAAQAINNAHPDAYVAQEVVQAHVTEQIARLADKWGADLVILGSHGRHGFDHFVLGSVSLALTSELKKPLILVKPSQSILKLWDSLDFPTLFGQHLDKALARAASSQTKQRILLTIDDTEAPSKLMQFCAAHDWGSDSAIRLVSVVERVPHLLMPADKLQELDRLAYDAREKQLSALAEELRKELPSAHISCVVKRGAPSKTILEEAKSWEASMLMVGCNLRSSIGRFFLGSVSLTLLCSSPCSVLLLKNGGGTGGKETDSPELSHALTDAVVHHAIL